VVTGAGRGIGRAIALSVGAAGFHTLCVSRTDTAEQTRRAITSAGGRSDAVAVDLADHDATEKAISSWISAQPYRRLGIVLAAGVLGPVASAAGGTLTDWTQTFAVNVVGNLVVFHALQSRFMGNGGRGRIVFFGGGGAAYANPQFPAYAASKAAIVRTVENLHEGLHPDDDVAVVCLAPGAVETDMLRELRAKGAPTRATAPVEEAVGFVDAFLRSEGARALSGRFVHVRDRWDDVLAGVRGLRPDEWKLRRIE
jgi:3-oxoacyl-[acyl-carrier protein] reductase